VVWIHVAQDRPLVGPCKYGNEPLVYIKGGEFVEELSDY
jgi:hypothetical protein